MDGTLSQWTEVPSSVPQGSILGPLLFLTFIGDLGQDLPQESQTSVRKYVDDSKALRGNASEEDVIQMQEDLDALYMWEGRNRMPFNSTKFMVLRMTVDWDRTLPNSTTLFTPGYKEPIEEVEVAKDLGVLLDADGTFKSHQLKAQKKTMQRCSWIMRTFFSRDPGLLKSLWQSLAQPFQDYASQLWYPVGNTGGLAWQEKPLRMVTRKMKGLRGMNYWERLEQMKMLSSERRSERYKLLYLWKTLYGDAPSLGIEINTPAGSRLGLTLKIPQRSGTKELVQTMKDRFFTGFAPKLFNCLPVEVRESESFGSFKAGLDVFLMGVPDKPVLAGYHTPNWAKNGRQSNSILDWTRNYPDIVNKFTMPSVVEGGSEEDHPGLVL